MASCAALAAASLGPECESLLIAQQQAQLETAMGFQVHGRRKISIMETRFIGSIDPLHWECRPSSLGVSKDTVPHDGCICLVPRYLTLASWGLLTFNQLSPHL